MGEVVCPKKMIPVRTRVRCARERRHAIFPRVTDLARARWFKSLAPGLAELSRPWLESRPRNLEYDVPRNHEAKAFLEIGNTNC